MSNLESRAREPGTPHVLITGAAGNIGSELAHALVSSERYRVTGVDDLSTGSRTKLPSGSRHFSFIKGDVNDFRDYSAVFLSHRFDYVFHLAAVVGVHRTLEQPLSVLRDVDGIRNTLLLAKNTGVRRVFFSSSSEVYGEPVSLPQFEATTPLNSRLPYAVVKNIGEAFMRSYQQEHGLDYTIFRLFNTYGPNQSLDFVVPRFLSAALEGKPIAVFGEGLQTRTFCFIDDTIDTMVKCLEQGAHINDVLNVGSDVEWRIRDLAQLVIDVTGSSSQIEHAPALPEGDMPRRQPDISKMRMLLGREPLDLREGLRRMLPQHAAGVR